jgi:hypothetical protein
MQAIDQALSASRLLFPRGGERMHVETLVDALLKPDIQTRYEAYKAARQAGWLTANEIRALENYPPKDGGDELQAPRSAAPSTTRAPPPTPRRRSTSSRPLQGRHARAAGDPRAARAPRMIDAVST